MSNFLKDMMAKIVRKFTYYEIWSERVAKPTDDASDFLSQISSCMGCLRPRPKDATAGHKVATLPAEHKMPKLRDVQQLLHRKKRDLYALAGEKGGRLLYEDHVQQWDYVLIYANADWKKGQEVRMALEKSRDDVAVSGPWHIKLGDLSLTAWERMLTSTSVVVVLVSKELYREKILNLCFPEILSGVRRTRVVPLFLEDVDESEMARELRPIRWRQGIALFRNGVDATVRELARHTFAQHRYLREIVNIDNLLQRSKCLSRTCTEPVEAPERIQHST